MAAFLSLPLLVLALAAGAQGATTTTAAGSSAAPTTGTTGTTDVCATAGCGANTACVLDSGVAGAVWCMCTAGHEGNDANATGVDCTPIDNCAAAPCGSFSACTATGPGTHTCACLPGYASPAQDGANCRFQTRILTESGVLQLRGEDVHFQTPQGAGGALQTAKLSGMVAQGEANRAAIAGILTPTTGQLAVAQAAAELAASTLVTALADGAVATNTRGVAKGVAAVAAVGVRVTNLMTATNTETARLDTKIGTTKTGLEMLIGQNSGAITKVRSDLTGTIGTLDQTLSGKVTAAEGRLNSKITAVTTAYKAADSTLNSAVLKVSADLQSAEDMLVDRVEVLEHFVFNLLGDDQFNSIGNGMFESGQHVARQFGSYGRYTIVTLPSSMLPVGPTPAKHALRFDGGGSEYEVHQNSGKVLCAGDWEISAYAYVTTNWVGAPQLLHSRWFPNGRTAVVTGGGFPKTRGQWERISVTATIPTTASSYNWYVGYPMNLNRGNVFVTALNVARKQGPC